MIEYKLRILMVIDDDCEFLVSGFQTNYFEIFMFGENWGFSRVIFELHV